MLRWAAVFSSLLLVACSSQRTESCNMACERYGACFDDELDVDGCTDRCVDGAAANDSFSAELDQCEACMEMEGCSPPKQGHVAFDCYDECGFVLGETTVHL